MLDRIYIYIIVKFQSVRYFFQYKIFGKETPDDHAKKQDPFIYED